MGSTIDGHCSDQFNDRSWPRAGIPVRLVNLRVRADINTQCGASRKTLDERLHLAKIGVNLTELRKDQADYIGVPVAGPFKADHYRY